MKISRNWLQKYVSKEIPKGEDFVNLLSMNIFEVEGFEKLKNGDEVFDVKVLADRNAYCLSHRGIARELAVLLDAEFKIPENKKNVVESLPNYEAMIETSGICRKCLLRKVTDINILESPEWLKTALESVGQRSISPIVDATNYVMLDTGQPLHAFDADLVDDWRGIVLLLLCRESYPFVENHRLLSGSSLPLLWLRNGCNELRLAPDLDDLLRRLPLGIEFPMPLRRRVGGVQDRMIKKEIGHKNEIIPLQIANNATLCPLYQLAASKKSEIPSAIHCHYFEKFYQGSSCLKEARCFYSKGRPQIFAHHNAHSAH